MADDPNLKLADIPVTDASETEADLNAKINEELGLEPEPVVEKPDDTPEPVKEDSEDPDADPEQPAGEEDAGEPEPDAEPEPEPEEAPPAEAAEPSDEDLFIEVEDAEGVTHKISSIEDLPEDFAPKNNRQILEIIKATDRLDDQRAQRDADAEIAKQEAFTEQVKQDQFKSWDKEVEALAKDKRIDSSDTDRINEVFGYMNEVNKARTEAGNQNLITSFEDALDKFEIKESKDKAASDKQNDNARAKAKTALIGKSSAAAGGDTYVYRAGSARSIDDIPV